MLTIFNRKELTITFSMKQQAEIRNELQNNGIDYKYKIINRNSPSPVASSRGKNGTLGQDLDLACEYVLYVNRKDYEKAKQVLGIK